jgi:hypothetical protein
MEHLTENKVEIRLKIEVDDRAVKTIKAFAIIAVINALFCWFHFGVMS